MSFLRVALGFALFSQAWISVRAAELDPVVRTLVDHVRAHPRGEAPFSFDRRDYELTEEERRALPIGVFDSGIGGLTVLEALLKVDAHHNETLQPGADGVPDFAGERFLYLGDQANMPYGRYPSEGKTDYLRELILKDVTFLLGKRWREQAEAAPRLDKPPVKAIVIACNTATAYGLEDIRAALAAWQLPVIVVGVVEAGARGVLEARRGESEPGAIAVLATQATCRSEAYPRAIGSALGRAGHRISEMVQQGSGSLAGIIEGNPAYDLSLAEQARRDVRELLNNHRVAGGKEPIRTVVLGCTHYPLALDEIEAAFAQVRREDEALGALIAPELHFVDPAEWTARELFRALAQARLRRKDPAAREARAEAFFLSVPHPEAPRLGDGSALDPDYQYGRECGQLGLEDTVVLSLTPERLPESGRQLVRNRLPQVWSDLQAAAAR